MSKFALARQTFLAKKPCKSLLISTLCRQGNCFTKENFTGLNNTSIFSTKKTGWRPAEKKFTLFQHASSSTKISMTCTYPCRYKYPEGFVSRAQTVANVEIRVTKLDEFSPIVRLFTSGSFFEWQK
jgi:hypothetical protein